MSVLNTKQQESWVHFLKKKNLFITGPAGTGKTFLIRHIHEYALRNNIPIGLTAMTGQASSLFQGKTFHSWAGIGLGKETATQLVSKIRRFPPNAKKWREVKILVIDEVSMLTASLFEKIDTIAKELRKNSQPFGGIQILLFGDFCQIPPVDLRKQISQTNLEMEMEMEMEMEALSIIARPEQFCFQSPIWNTSINKIIELTEIVRQIDPVFQTILNEIRMGQCSAHTQQILKQHLITHKTNKLKNDIYPTRLFTTNAKVDIMNEQELKKLGKDIVEYNATAKFTYTKPNFSLNAQEEKNIADKIIEPLPAQKTLQLSIGAQVMCVANIDAPNIINGSRGVITGFTNKMPIVRWLSNPDEDYIVMEHVWETVLPNYTVSVRQTPLRLAWAITIHKCQGMTIDYVEIDAGSSIFEYGQTYVALSRVRSLDGLLLLQFNPAKIKIHPDVLQFYTELHTCL